ncbi:hypothetical protein Sjap_017354 [Stephania japonica]|uniref:Uncharacterized protein n=1 Tax=Stephania japonica TaxID=461633 RepID=A0AAP0I610_9MAGN
MGTIKRPRQGAKARPRRDEAARKQGKARRGRGKARQGWARQGKARPRQDKARQGKARHVRQGGTTINFMTRALTPVKVRFVSFLKKRILIDTEVALQYIRKKIDAIGLEDDYIDAEILNSWASIPPALRKTLHLNFNRLLGR